MRFSRVVAFLVFFLGFEVISTLGQQVVATWTGGGADSFWNDPANWSTLTVPSNIGGTTYSVIIDIPNAVVINGIGTIDNLTLGTTDNLNLASLNLVSGASSNSGTIGYLGPAALSIDSGAFLTNNGGIGGSDFAFLSNSGTLINNSVIKLFNDSSISNTVDAYFANPGTISIDAGSLGNAGRFSNSGTINVTSQSDPSAFANSGMFNNSGTMTVSLTNFEPNSFSNNGTLNNSGTMTVDADLPVGLPASISNSGTIKNTGTLNITTSAGAGFSNSGAISNTGALNMAQSPTNMGGSFGNSGTLSNWGTISNSGVFTNSGAVLINRTGLFTTSTNYTQTAGSTFVNGTLTATNGALVDIHGGVLGGTGTINGNVLMAGTMMPGDAPGTLTIFGNYEQSGTGFFHELMSPYAQAFLDVSGNVVLDPGASLDITLLGGFNPLGDTISIMDFSTLSGQFANGSSFWDDNFLWDITYRQHEIDVTAVQAPEPSSLLLLALGSLAIGAFVKRKKWHNGSLVGRLT